MLFMIPVLSLAVTSKNVVEYDKEGDLGKAIPAKSSPQDVTANFAFYALYFLGATCVGFIIYGGFMWALAAGSQDKVVKARGIVISALIGLVLTLSAWTIGYFIFTSISG